MAKILVIENEKEYRENICLSLEGEGYETIESGNGEEGVKMAKEHLPDLILCDIMMDEKDGFYVIKKLKKEMKTSGIPFIFLTVLESEKNVEEGIKSGAQGYIVKTNDKDKILFIIKRQLDLIEQKETFENCISSMIEQVEGLRSEIQKFGKEKDKQMLEYKTLFDAQNNHITFLREIVKDYRNLISEKTVINNKNEIHIKRDTFKNINDSYINIGTHFSNQLSQLKNKYGDDIVNDMERVLDKIKKSADDTLEYIKKFIDELNCEKPRKSILEDYLDKIIKLFPLAKEIFKSILENLF